MTPAITPAAAAADPLAAVDALHAAAAAPAADGDWGVAALFEAVANDPVVGAQVPLLTDVPIESLRPGSLVRYRGMVQDTLDPEYYLGAYRAAPGAPWTTTKYRDARVPPGAHAVAAGGGGAGGEETPGLVHERRPLYCIAVPGEKAGGAAAAASAAVAAAAAPAPPSDRKRGRADAGAGADPMDEDAAAAQPKKDAPRPASGASATGGEGGDTAAANKEDGAALPAPALRPPAPGDALVYAYDHTPSPPKLNDVVEVWGVVSVVPELGAAHDDAAAARGGDGGGADFALAAALAAHPPTSAVPRVHALVHLGGCPAGDAGAAGDALTPFAASLAAALADLAPAVVALPLTVPSLNARRLRPARCPATGRLAAAPLQVAAGTHVVLDEGGLAPGKLGPLGVDNVQAISSLLTARAIDYDFHYCRVEVPVDAPVLALSAGRASVVAGGAAADVSLVLAPDPAAAAAVTPPSDDDLAAARALLGWARHAPFDFAGGEGGDAGAAAAAGAPAPPAAPAWLEAKLVAARRADGGSEARLHTLLTLARLLALSHGEGALTEARWDGAVALDAAAAGRRAVGPVRSAYTG